MIDSLSQIKKRERWRPLGTANHSTSSLTAGIPAGFVVPVGGGDRFSLPPLVHQVQCETAYDGSYCTRNHVPDDLHFRSLG